MTNSRLSLANAQLTNEQLEQERLESRFIPLLLEKQLRCLGAELIQQAALFLDTPQVCTATAQVLFQRFYYQKSFLRFNLLDIAMGAMFLACKTEESSRRIRDVVNAFHVVHYVWIRGTLQGYEPLAAVGQKYYEFRDNLVYAEMHLLKELGFNVQVQHGHALLLSYMQSMELTEDKALCQRAWNYLNDTHRTSLWVKYQPPTMATACIWLAATRAHRALPSAWWRVFDSDEEDMLNVIATLEESYQLMLSNELPLTADALQQYIS